MPPDQDAATAERKGREWRLEVLERRREQADSFTWGVPGFAIAGQAFLLAIVLNPETQPSARLIASLAGLFTVLGLGHLLFKQIYLFDYYEAVIEKERRALDLPGVQLDALRKLEPFPRNTLYRQRGWANRRKPRYWIAVRLRSVQVWFWVFLALAAIDGFLFLVSLLEVSGVDVGWFDAPTSAPSA